MTRAKKEPETLGRVSARKVLDGAKKFVGKDVIVIGKTRGGDFYRAQSMPNKSVADYDHAIKLLEECLKRMKKNRRTAEQVEREAAAKRGIPVPA